MNQIIIWIVVAAVVFGGGYLFLSSSQQEGVAEDGSMTEGEMMKADDAATEGTSLMEGTMMEEGDEAGQGSYEPYAPEKLARADSGDVVLFFRASWCPTCKMLDSDIRANISAIPAGLTILSVDYDNSSVLKQKYGVTYQHTFVQVASDGTLIKKWSGSPTLASLVSQVQ